jgi:hypothetical protein
LIKKPSRVIQVFDDASGEASIDGKGREFLLVKIADNGRFVPPGIIAAVIDAALGKEFLKPHFAAPDI